MLCEEAAAAMPEPCAASACLDVETIYLGGKVLFHLFSPIIVPIAISYFQFSREGTDCVLIRIQFPVSTLSNF